MGDIIEQLPGQIDILSQEDPGEYDDLFIMPVDEYKSFLSKFEAKKTTDDCYTPPAIYDAVAEWVSREYGVDRKNFVRPFFPGGDYQRETYRDEDIVVDNPPFSLLAQIIGFYNSRNVRFFLFAPTLTLFSSTSSCCSISVGVSVTYENGAKVSTSFVTNMEPGIRFRSAPELYTAVRVADEKTRNETKVELPKYHYPPYVVTAAAVAAFSKYGIEFSVPASECAFIRQLDSQKNKGKTIFGAGYLISEKKKADREKADREKADREKVDRWELSDREIQIVKSLNKED